MRLLRCDGDGIVTLTEWPLLSKAPKYAILSHTWGDADQEVTFRDINDGVEKEKTEYRKIEFCRKQAAADGLHYFWVDTCCIDKSDHSELSEAINSMFRWYRNAAHCYVYLSDVSQITGQPSSLWKTQFQQSRWFTRGWTLQELLAPVSVKFFSIDGAFLGDKVSLENEIYGITRIKIPALRGSPLDQFPIHERMNWAAGRQTTKEEDSAYCMLGIFDVYIPLIYGEGGPHATSRLLEAVDRRRGTTNVTLPQHEQFDSRINLPIRAYHSTPEVAQNAHLLVPFGQNDEFVGRETILKELVNKILPNAKRNDCQRTVLEGLGGVGKTQIALEAAYRVHQQDSDCSIFWVPAVTMVTFENAYGDIGEALDIPGIGDENADVKALVKRALQRSAMNWLLIIDNADDISLWSGESISTGESLQDYLPFSRRGSILFTTRNHEVAVRLDVSKKDTFVVDEMSEEEALELLQSGLQERQYQDAQATKNLVRQLVYLPLAIKQASAHMARTRLTTGRYLELCIASDETQIKLLNTNFEERRRYSRDTNPITMTWLISFQHLAKSCPLAVEYLKFICFLAEKDIPLSCLPPGEDEQAQNEAVGLLEAYAFISIRELGDSFDIHRLVRLATRNWIKAEWETYCTMAIRQIANVYPFPKHENREVWIRYMPHAEMALQVYNQCMNKEAAADVLHNVAESYTQLVKYEMAERMYCEALELKKSVLRLDHLSTLYTMNNLAVVLYRRGKYEEAEQIHRETLDIRKSTLGPNHPSTSSSINNLALVLYRRGEYEEAEQMHRETLKLRKSTLGPDHPLTLISTNNLAIVLHSRGKYEEAEQMNRETLKLLESVRGPEHSSTLDSMNNLALVLRSRGKYEEAEQMHRETLKLRKTKLGSDHPLTLSSMNNLALVLRSRGKYEEAEQMYREALEVMKSVLDSDHPSTLGIMDNLVAVLSSLGKYEEAEHMQREALRLKGLALGPDHPSTLQSMNNLALVFYSRGKYEKAEQIHRETLQLKELVLKSDHPSTLSSTSNLAIVLSNLGKYEEAEGMFRKILVLRHAVLGPNHPTTLHNMNNLANVLRYRGEYEEAAKMHRHVLEAMKHVLDSNHPSILTSISNLGLVLVSLGKYEQAEARHRQALDLKKPVLGLCHPSTLDSMNNLANVLRRTEKSEEAEQIHHETLELRESMLGKDHPSTLASMNNLALVLGSLGKLKEAEEMHREALELKKLVLKPENPSIISSMNNLANVLPLRGKYEAAKQLHQDTLELRNSVLGINHPLTKQSQENLKELSNTASEGCHKSYSEATSDDPEGESGFTL